MQKPKKWNTELIATPENHKFNCNRCNTKNTHAVIIGKVISDEINNPVHDQEGFLLIKCSTCGGLTIEYNYYKGQAKKLPSPPSLGMNSNINPLRFTNELLFDKKMYFPLSSSIEEVPEFIKYDYLKMKQCYQIGSTEGVSIHCRRILDKIFSAFEKKLFNEIDKKAGIKIRVKKITEKCPYFSIINESIKNLKSVVSNIVHRIDEDIGISNELKIEQNSFKEILDFVDALLKIYDLEFSITPNLEKKYKKIKKS